MCALALPCACGSGVGEGGKDYRVVEAATGRFMGTVQMLLDRSMNMPKSPIRYSVVLGGSGVFLRSR